MDEAYNGGATAGRSVLGYLRVSSDKQEVKRQERTLPERHALLPDGLAKLPLRLFYDDGISGWSGKPRPGFEDLKACIEGGKAAALIVDTSSRLTRRGIEEALTLFFALGRRDCRLFTVEGGEYTPDLGGVIRLAVEAEKDQRYSDDLSHNIATGKQAQASDGLDHHGTLPLGYRRGPDGVWEATQALPHVVEAFRMVGVERTTFEAACNYLNASVEPGLLAARYKGGKVERDRLRSYLRHPGYRGFVVHRDMRYQGRHTAAVTEDVWDAVQRRLDSNRDYSVRPPRSWPWTGIARCCCGGSLRQHPVKGHVYLRCSRQNCSQLGPLPLAAVFEANVLVSLVAVAHTLRTRLDDGESFAGPVCDPEVAQGGFDALQKHVEQLGGLIADGAIPPDDERYVRAVAMRDGAREALKLAKRASASYEGEIRGFVETVLGLAARCPSWAKRMIYDEPTVVVEATGYELAPDRELVQALFGWDEADFETQASVIGRCLDRVEYGHHDVSLTLATPVPLKYAIPCGVERHPTAVRLSVEASRRIVGQIGGGLYPRGESQTDVSAEQRLRLAVLRIALLRTLVSLSRPREWWQ